jgi:hypothetical protein
MRELIQRLEESSDRVLRSSLNRQHEAILKKLQREMKRMGWKYKRGSQSAMFDWGWSKGDPGKLGSMSLTLDGWAPKRNWGDSYTFFAVYHNDGKGRPYDTKVVWENPYRDKIFDQNAPNDEKIPRSDVGKYLKYAEEAGELILRLATAS